MATKAVPKESGRAGNTMSARKRCWMLTWNNYTREDHEMLKKHVSERCTDYVIQEEVGENGTPHLQGYVYYKSAREFKTLKKEWPKVHWEPTNNMDAARKYCKKEETRAPETEPFEKEENTKKKTEDYPGNEHDWDHETFREYDPLYKIDNDNLLLPWQKEIKNMLDTKPDRRKVHWFWEKKGNTGKSTFAYHLAMRYPGQVLVLDGDAKDVFYAVKTYVTGKKGTLDPFKSPLKMIIYDLPKSREFTDALYNGMEKIKDGLFFNTKYEPGMVIMKPVHLIIFANRPPFKEMLSRDRWDIRNIDNNKEETSSDSDDECCEY